MTDTKTDPSQAMLPVENVVEDMSKPGLGFERVQLHRGSTYRDSSTVIIIPTRGMIHHRVVAAWQNLIAPMNQKRAVLFAAGDEVGHAYDNMIKMVLAHPEMSKWKYILTLEDDNIPPPDAHIRLLETIEQGYDAVGGIYFTKGPGFNAPQAYGDPAEYARTGVLDFRPRDIRECLRDNVSELESKGSKYVMDVNGIAMGCSLYRMQLFRDFPYPWFVTCNDWVEGVGAKVMTQDLEFCEKAKRASPSRRFAVDLRVRVGHLDVEHNILY